MHAPVFVGRFTGALGDQQHVLMLPKRVCACMWVSVAYGTAVWVSRCGWAALFFHFRALPPLEAHTARTSREGHLAARAAEFGSGSVLYRATV